jgi:single-stranded-DNA-specific exonuclease
VEISGATHIWLQAEPVHPPAGLLKATGNDELVAAILTRRGMTDPDQVRGFLNPDEYTPAPPWQFPGMETAVNRILEAIRLNQRILVWGDFDVDGQTSTTILYQTFQSLGANVDFHIPNRETEGHGIHIPTLQKYLSTNFDLVVTCDTGISEVDAVAIARESGVDVIITDHHEIPAVLPADAVAIINPRLLPTGHPLSTLPGCGVAFKLAEALLEKTGRLSEAENYLDLAALGIVADLADLTGDARYILQRGLVKLRENKRLGLVRLLQLIELDPTGLNEEHLAFYLAPRLNALGRLANASLAVDFFTTSDEARAAYLAQELDGLNTRRKLLSDQVLQGALALIEQHPAWLNDPVLVLDHPDWPGGVLGIVASQLVNRYQRPVIMLQSREGSPARGSARSVTGINITQAIASHADMLRSFGGHPMAAGLSLDIERIPEFRQALGYSVAKQVQQAPPPNQWVIDAEIPIEALSLELAERLNRLSPFGQGNPAPLLSVPMIHILQSNPVGKYRDHLILRLENDTGATIDAIWWQGAGQPIPDGWVKLAYSVRTTTYRGADQLQVEWVDSLPLSGTVDLPASGKGIPITDYRSIPNPLIRLGEIRAGNNSLVWAEADAHSQVLGKDRCELSQAEILIIWTTPPGSEELKQVLSQVVPHKLVLFFQDPGLDEMEPFVRRLLGVMHYLSVKEGKALSLDKLAAATAQRKDTIELGLRYLAVHGDLILRSITADTVQFDWSQNKPGIQVNEAASHLAHSLAETAAFRRTLQVMSLDDWRKTWM